MNEVPREVLDSFYAFIDSRDPEDEAVAVREPIRKNSLWDGLIRFYGRIWHFRLDSRGRWFMHGDPVDRVTP